MIANVSFHSSRHSQSEEDEWLTADKMAVSAFEGGDKFSNEESLIQDFVCEIKSHLIGTCPSVY